MANFSKFMGKHIVTSTRLIKISDPFPVKRTLKERFFSWPWKPWVATKMITTQEPSDKIIWFDNYIVMHPELLQQINNAADHINGELKCWE